MRLSAILRRMSVGSGLLTERIPARRRSFLSQLYAAFESKDSTEESSSDHLLRGV